MQALSASKIALDPRFYEGWTDMNPTHVPNIEEEPESRLKEISEDQRKSSVEKTLPQQVADRTKRQVEKSSAPQSEEK